MMERYKFLASFLERSRGSVVTFLCGDVSRNFCENMADVAKNLGRRVRVFEIIKEQQRRKAVETAEIRGFSKLARLLTRSQTLMKFALRLVQTKVGKEVVDSVRDSDAVVWVGLREDFDVFYLVDRRLVDAVMGKNFLLLSFPSKYTAEKLGISYEGYWENFLNALNYPWEEMKVLGENLKTQLVAGDALRVMSPLGTDFTLRFKAVDIRVFYGVVNEKALGKGTLQLQLPAGELFIILKEPSINGEMLFDVPCLLNGQLVSNVKVVVKNGVVVDYEADENMDALDKFFREKELRKVGEIGFGLNPAIKPCGSAYLDEKAYRTVHVGFGQMKTLGHTDFVMSSPTVFVNKHKLEWTA